MRKPNKVYLSWKSIPQKVRDEVVIALREDIFLRYDNSEYWDISVANAVLEDNGVEYNGDIISNLE